jgi:hypothetical protein
MSDDTTVISIPAQDLRAGDRYLAAGGQLREVTRVWRSNGAHLFAGSRARVTTVQARVAGVDTPVGFELGHTLTVIRTVS